MKIRFHGVGCASKEREAANVEHCRALGLPDVGQAKRPRLAVIGGGHSVKEHIDELREFDGDCWISASAYKWCKEQGIDGWFFAIGPEPHIADMVGDADKAVLSSAVDPGVFACFSGKPVRVLELVSEGEMINHGPSTVTAGFYHALMAGYREVTFYGCDSSYPEGSDSHAYENSPHPYRVNIACNGEFFHTEALLLLQAEYMAKMISLAPHVFKEKSGGLLRAMTKDPEYDITHGSAELHELLKAA